jgi:hypothetical protein
VRAWLPAGKAAKMADRKAVDASECFNNGIIFVFHIVWEG